jgi:hypothetical protein
MLETQSQEFIRSWDSVKQFAFDNYGLSQEDSDTFLVFDIQPYCVESHPDHESVNKRAA